jgi:hypothetical protein
MATISPASLVLPTNLSGVTLIARSLLLDFGPDGLLFQPGKVRATVPFDRAAVTNLSALALYRLDEARLAWEPVPGGAVTGTTAFAAPLAHFSRYALLELVKASAATITTPAPTSAPASAVRSLATGQWAGARQVWMEGVASAVLLSAVFLLSLCGSHCCIRGEAAQGLGAKGGSTATIVTISAETAPAPGPSTGRQASGLRQDGSGRREQDRARSFASEGTRSQSVQSAFGGGGPGARAPARIAGPWQVATAPPYQGTSRQPAVLPVQSVRQSQSARPLQPVRPAQSLWPAQSVRQASGR